MSDKIEFKVSGFKKNGEKRDRTFKKINDALKYLWCIKEAQEIYLEVLSYEDDCVRTYILFAKIGRKRGLNGNHATISPKGISFDKIGIGWIQLSSKFNDLD